MLPEPATVIAKVKEKINGVEAKRRVAPLSIGGCMRACRRRPRGRGRSGEDDRNPAHNPTVGAAKYHARAQGLLGQWLRQGAASGRPENEQLHSIARSRSFASLAGAAHPNRVDVDCWHIQSDDCDALRGQRSDHQPLAAVLAHASACFV